MTAPVPSGAFATLQAFARPRPAVECCELCDTVLDAAHDHLLDRELRLRCTCVPCGRLMEGAAGWARVRHRVQRLLDFRLSDNGWQALGLPIGLVFFVWSSAAECAMARYPSAGGPVESSLALPAWDRLTAANPVLAGLQPDVEALLVNRIGRRREHYLVSIDECYRLVGLLRLHWRGFGGGGEVHDRIERFFVDLERAGRSA